MVWHTTCPIGYLYCPYVAGYCGNCPEIPPEEVEEDG